MDPLSVAVIGGNLVGGLMSARDQRRQREQEVMMKAAEMQAQPYMKKDVQKTQVTTASQSPWQGLLKGGLAGASQVQAFQKAGLIDSAKGAESVAAPKKFDEELDQLTPQEELEVAQERMKNASLWPMMRGRMA